MLRSIHRNSQSALNKAFRRLTLPESEQVKFDAHTIYLGHYEVSYRGVKALRCPFDYVIYQMIISDLRPDVVIEIGTNFGGSALYLADLMESIGYGVVHTIDVARNCAELVANHPRISVFSEGWQGYDTELVKGLSRVLVIEDATHVYEDTLGAIKRFAPLVSPGSYLIVEDGIISELGLEKKFHGGPLRAINVFLESNDAFVVDEHWQNLFGRNATFNVKGYLKRVR